MLSVGQLSTFGIISVACRIMLLKIIFIVLNENKSFLFTMDVLLKLEAVLDVCKPKIFSKRGSLKECEKYAVYK